MAPDRVDPERELDAVAAALAHDLRAPLRAIDGFSQILLADERGVLPDDTRRYLELVRDAGSEVADLLDDLVDIVRVTRVALDVRDLDPGALARELIDAVLAPRATVTWVVGDLPRCRADQALTRRLLEELLDNAVKFGARRVELLWDADARAYCVRDDGIGVDGDLPAQALAIFGRLHGREEHPGTGAGLALASRIAARHGGRLWGRGTAGAGTTVWFTLTA
ncbi:Phytochrome-like protein cph1 [Baekduia alba]|uniref:sensor histidine kinase n=1 Tax=Baekduia alba TaxID=2997333 RepID=UPI002340BE2D|nr:ATP-binding protein [Baekduia alba]WCB93262.1 Phytochrome-like protein cph1 [Baekduia alba]